MKTITKFFTIAATAAAFLSPAAVKAQDMTMAVDTTPVFQKALRLGVGISGGITRDNSPFDYGLGADLRLQWDLQKHLSLTATGGYTRLMAKNDLPDYDFIPLKGGVKVFPGQAFYALGELGAGLGIKENSKTSFIWSGGIGYAWKNGLDISARYESYQQDSNSSTYYPVNGQYALRLAYGFKL